MGRGGRQDKAGAAQPAGDLLRSPAASVAAISANDLRSPSAGQQPAWITQADTERQITDSDLAGLLLRKPAAEQPWMVAADRFQGGAAGWDWDPSQMREIISYPLDEGAIYLVASRGDGGRGDSAPTLTVFAQHPDDIGEPEIWGLTDVDSAEQAAADVNEMIEQYGAMTNDEVTAEMIRSRLRGLTR